MFIASQTSQWVYGWPVNQKTLLRIYIITSWCKLLPSLPPPSVSLTLFLPSLSLLGRVITLNHNSTSFFSSTYHPWIKYLWIFCIIQKHVAMDCIVFRNIWCSLIKNNKNKYTFFFFFLPLLICVQRFFDVWKKKSLSYNRVLAPDGGPN